MAKQTWTNWGKGLLAAFVTGMANSIMVVIVDPVAFSPTEQTSKLAMVALISGIFGAAAYLKQSPLPKDE
jgi:fucose permease